MNKTKFTKGDWEMSLDIGGKTLIHSDGETICGGIDCKHQGNNFDVHNVEAEANAHLIVASPEMYRELSELAEWLKYREDYKAWSERVNNLLASARGEK